MLRQFFLQLPRELDDAARIDGAGHFTHLLADHPAAVQAGAGLAVRHPVRRAVERLPLAAGRHQRHPAKRTLPAALTLFSSTGGVDHAALMAGAAISLSPLALAFLLAQRFFVQGVAASGVK